LTVAALALLLGPSIQAATVQQMNLQELVGRAHLIFRGTVLDVREGKVAVGGGELPTYTYRIRVDEAFKGTFSEVKGMQIAEVTTIGKLPVVQGPNARLVNALPEIPRLQVGKDYLLLTTQPSSVGLSVPVGLGQGSFLVSGKPGQEIAVNGNNNLGLFLGMTSGFAAGGSSQSGPVSYSTLAGMIHNLVGA
jgi:hypothetical protein